MIVQVLLLLWVFQACTECYKFEDISYEKLHQRVLDLNRSQFATVFNASTAYGIPPSKLNGYSCSPDIIKLSVDAKRPRSSEKLPSILISGAIHGDERVGPLVSIVTAELLLASAECSIAQSSVACDSLQNYNISPNQIDWLAFMVYSREIFIIPAANCMGYANMRRDDVGVDPNRDFPYMRKDTKCLRSSSAKLIYSIMSEIGFHMLVTFHGGMEAIAYEWGSVNHKNPNDISPDNNAFADVANVLKASASATEYSRSYKVGTMNSIVYPVDGGMEDWAYAANWDKGNLRHCDGISMSLQKSENNADRSLGCAVFLVEASNRKKPAAGMLGSRESILETNSTANGHIPRNVRLSLAATDLISPSVCLTKVFSSSLIPLSSERLQNLADLEVSWRVGGAVKVDATWLTLRQVNDQDGVSRSFVQQNISSSYRGPYRPSWRISEKHMFARITSSELRDTLSKIPSASENAMWALEAWAQVDSHWGWANQGFPRNFAPQSLLVNSRFERSEQTNWKSPRLWKSEPILLLLQTVDTKISISVLSFNLNCATWKVTNKSESIQLVNNLRAWGVNGEVLIKAASTQTSSNRHSTPFFYALSVFCIGCLIYSGCTKLGRSGRERLRMKNYS